jgi:uncharacterized alkaline shock family protein YloU
MSEQNACEESNVSIEYIKQVAAMSAMECFGVVGMSNKNSADDFIELLRRDNLGKGVKIDLRKINV